MAKDMNETNGDPLDLLLRGWADRLAGDWRPGAPVAVDAAFRLELDTFTGTPTLQARLCALAPARSQG